MKRFFCFGSIFLLAAGVAAQDDPRSPRLLVEATITTETQTAYDVAWHPNGELIAIQGGAEVTIYDTDLQPVTPALEPTGANLAWSPDGDQLATVEGFRARELRLWDWDGETFEETEPVVIDDNYYAVTWSPDGESLVTLNDDGELTLSAPDAEPITFQSVPLAVNIAWSPDGTQLAVLSYERQLQIWQVSELEN